jgi:hypothetical protein
MRAESEVESGLAVGTSGIVVRAGRAIILKQALQEAAEERALVLSYVAKHMREGTDYGVIPGAGTTKVLLKPGAEKLVELFRCTPKFTLLTNEERWEGNGFFNYMFRARIVSRDAKEVLAEGYGSSNSHEGKHRWRNANRKCPSCGKEAIIQGKAEYGGGWLCFKRKGGCGAKFADQDPTITSQEAGKVENTDAADLANTVLKMAKKRALVDAAIALARCSDMFTQDIEDFVPEDTAPAREEPQATAPQRPRAVASAKPPAVIDVKAGETEEEATVRALPAPRIHQALSDADLSSALDDARSRLESMGASSKTREGMKARLAGLEAELDARMPKGD